MAAIRWTIGARNDLREIVNYIQQDSLIYAAETANRIISAIERLAAFPLLGRKVPEYDQEFLREILVGNYRVVYLSQEGVIGIIAMVHVTRDLSKRLHREPWDFE